uniref:Uncharacterized protein n=1 Tax=Arundo donax TaxID=35708 RepID=A0A0A8Y7J8_ARUDO
MTVCLLCFTWKTFRS